VLIWIFILWNILSVFWSVEIDSTIVRIKTYVQLGILSWILWDLYSTQKDLRAALQAYILGAYIAIGSTIFNYFAGQAIEGRYTAAGFNANDLSLTLALGIPLAWHLAVSENNGTKVMSLRLVNYFYVPAAALTIVLTASRGSLLASVPALFFIFVSLHRLNFLSRLTVVFHLDSSLFYKSFFYLFLLFIMNSLAGVDA